MNYIYIVGSSHSGSTLLDLMLSNVADVFSMGEIAKLHRTTEEDKLCSCMKKVTECIFWKSIIQSLTEKDIKVVSYGDVRYNRVKYSNKKEFLIKYPLLLNAIVEKADVSTVCDSSKKVLRLKQLSKIKKIKLYVLFLTRHPGGYASSHVRKGRSFYYNLLSWVKYNHDVSIYLKNSNLQYRRIKYENLVKDPKKEAKEIFNLIRIDHDLNKINDFCKLRHMVAGNRIREKHQKLIIHAPDDWSKSLTTHQTLFANWANKYSALFLPK